MFATLTDPNSGGYQQIHHQRTAATAEAAPLGALGEDQALSAAGRATQ